MGNSAQRLWLYCANNLNVESVRCILMLLHICNSLCGKSPDYIYWVYWTHSVLEVSISQQYGYKVMLWINVHVNVTFNPAYGMSVTAEIKKEEKIGDIVESRKITELKAWRPWWAMESNCHLFHGVCGLSSGQLAYKCVWKHKPICYGRRLALELWWILGVVQLFHKPFSFLISGLELLSALSYLENKE